MTRRIFRYLTGTAVALCATFAMLAIMVLTADPNGLGDDTRSLLLIAAGTALAVSLGAVWLVAWVLSRPIDTLTRAALTVLSTDLTVKLTYDTLPTRLVAPRIGTRIAF